MQLAILHGQVCESREWKQEWLGHMGKQLDQPDCGVGPGLFVKVHSCLIRWCAFEYKGVRLSAPQIS